jgi:hypothetical protein
MCPPGRLHTTAVVLVYMVIHRGPREVGSSAPPLGKPQETEIAPLGRLGHEGLPSVRLSFHFPS